MADAGDLQAKLKILNDAYAAQLPEKLRQLDLASAGIPADGWDEAGFETLHRMAHDLIGSVKSFSAGRNQTKLAGSA